VKIRFISFCFSVLPLVFIEASPNLTSDSFFVQSVQNSNDSINIVYQNNTLFINGIYVNGNIKIYSIIGNMIMDMNIQNFSEVIIPVNLIRENLYIIRIETSDNRIFTHKIVAR
tara:strand:+ start:52 stop:393 length:342 start_codon:yes stop_codon:yes gene_type:complete